MNRKLIHLPIILLLMLLALCSAAAADTLQSGSCGENVAYTLDSDGVLTISGTGDMADYDYEGAPWYAVRSSVKTIRIGEGVTSIGRCAFRKCTSVTEVSIPQSVVTIDASAFYGCRRLAAINVPDSVESIGDYAFAGCTGLSTIELPSSVTSLGEEVFSGCSSLVSARLSAGMTQIPFNTFYECVSLTAVYIPEGIKTIGCGAFNGCVSLESIVLPESVQTIEAYAFSGCSSLAGVVIPDGVTSVEDAVFRNCVSLTSVYIPSSVTAIGLEAFYGCSGLTGVVIPDSVARIDKRAFYGCTELVTVYFYGSDMPEMGAEVFTLPLTVYCLKGSAVADWAVEAEHDVVYLDAQNPDKVISCTLPQLLRLQLNGETTVTPVLFPEQETQPTLKWSSSAPEIVSVAGGKLTGLAVGESTITVTCGDVSDSMLVTVYALLTDFRLSADEIWLVAGDVGQLDVVSLTPPEAKTLFTYASEETDAFTVDASGRITTAAVGEAVITVTSGNGIIRECTVHVCDPVTAIRFDQEQLTLSVGSTEQLKATVTAGEQTLVNQLITFSSSDEGVLRVDQNGLVKAVSTGSATVTATDDSGEISATVTILVRSRTSAILPDNLTAIEAEAFLSARFDEAVIPAGCKSIGARAFAGNTALTAVYIPASVTDIADDAFEGCSSVRFICTEDSAAAAYADQHGIEWAAE